MNIEKIKAWAIVQGNRVYETCTTRSKAREVKKLWESANNGEKFKLVKLSFDSFQR